MLGKLATYVQTDSEVKSVAAEQAAQHTAGPWHVCPPTRERPSEARVTALSGFVDIYAAPLTDETEANVRLIAAAPEMYEALEAITFAAFIDCPRNDAWKNLLQTCKDVLAKAKAEGR